jgi:hypothetical protein
MGAHTAKLRIVNRRAIDEQKERMIQNALRIFRAAMRHRRVLNPKEIDEMERELEERMRGRP